jgi:hypothetical protein
VKSAEVEEVAVVATPAEGEAAATAATPAEGEAAAEGDDKKDKKSK